MIFFEIIISFTLFMLLMAGLVVLLDRWIGIEHIGRRKEHNSSGKDEEWQL